MLVSIKKVPLCRACIVLGRVSLSLSLSDAVYPSGEGSATRVLLLQSSRSSTSTGVRFRLMRSCEMVFIHLFLCLPRFRHPCSSALRICLAQWSSSRRWTFPYHLSTRVCLQAGKPSRCVTLPGLINYPCCSYCNKEIEST